MLKWVPEDQLPKKRMASGVLLFDEHDKLLIVKPSYKNHWSVPGGIIDIGESPTNCCVRETLEEVGIILRNPRLVCVDYRSPTDRTNEHVHCIYVADTLNKDDVGNIIVDNDEIIDYKFVALSDALNMISPRIKRLIENTGIDRTTQCVFILKMANNYNKTL